MPITSHISIFPEKRFKPSPQFLRELFSELGVSEIASTFGESRQPLFSRIKDYINPQLIQPMFKGDIQFSEKNISTDTLISLWQEHKPYHMYADIPLVGWSQKVTAEAQTQLGDVSESYDPHQPYIPFECGITLPRWEGQSSSKRDLVFSSSFALTKTGYECPKNPIEYERRFIALEPVQRMLRFLNDNTSSHWSIALTGSVDY